jgi:hypothetical protein
VLLKALAHSQQLQHLHHKLVQSWRGFHAEPVNVEHSKLVQSEIFFQVAAQ